MRLTLPFFVSLIGILTDYFTTTVGLKLGFYEMHPQYHPALALLIFWGCLTLLTLFLPKRRFFEMSKNVLASASFLGGVNNTLLILGIFK